MKIFSQKCDVTIMRPSQGFRGTGGKRAFNSGEHGNKGHVLSGTGEQQQYWGKGNICQIIAYDNPFYFRG